VEEGIKLHVHNVSKIYRSDGHEVVAIDEIDLKIRNKEFATILGPRVAGSPRSFALSLDWSSRREEWSGWMGM